MYATLTQQKQHTVARIYKNNTLKILLKLFPVQFETN